jgi:hypothetical protein
MVQYLNENSNQLTDITCIVFVIVGMNQMEKLKGVNLVLKSMDTRNQKKWQKKNKKKYSPI